MSLPFGLSSAPRVFTKILYPVVGFLRSKDIRCVIYLDNILLDQDRANLMEHTAMTLSLLEVLGFLVNYPKSVLDPIQKLIFLGFIINLITKELSLGSDSQRGQGYSGAPEDLSLISRPANREDVSSITMAIQLAPLHYRSL